MNKMRSSGNWFRKRWLALFLSGSYLALGGATFAYSLSCFKRYPHGLGSFASCNDPVIIVSIHIQMLQELVLGSYYPKSLNPQYFDLAVSFIGIILTAILIYLGVSVVTQRFKDTDNRSE